MTFLAITPHGLIKSLLSNFSDMAGKTILSVIEENNHLVFRFTDGAAMIMSEAGEYGGYYAPVSDLWGKSEQVYFGLMSVADYEREERKREEKRTLENEARERMTFERLKRKYER